MRQKWGQNFLVDRGIAERIVRELGIAPDSVVLEVGPGRGVLTQFIVGKVKKIVAVELDRELAEFLGVKWAGESGLQVVQGDFLDWRLPRWPKKNVKVVGNLPYSAANAILRKLLDWASWNTMVVMVQKEVADRIVAAAGSRTYGILSLAVQAKAQVERLFDVAPGCFQPRPEVTSTVLRLTPLAQPLLRDEETFFRVVRAAFSQRRKTLLNSLAGGLNADKALVAERIRRAGLDPLCRAETVHLEEFKNLSELFRR